MTPFDELLEDPEFQRGYEEELLLARVSDALRAWKGHQDVSHEELARRLGWRSKGRVSQILSGNDNLTLRTVAAAAWALGLRIEPTLVPNTLSAHFSPSATSWTYSDLDSVGPFATAPISAWRDAAVEHSPVAADLPEKSGGWTPAFDYTEGRAA